MHLIEYRELYGYDRQLLKLLLCLGPPPRMPEIQVDDTQSMETVARKPQKNQDISHIPTPFEEFHVTSEKSVLRSKAGKEQYESYTSPTVVQESQRKVKFLQLIHQHVTCSCLNQRSLEKSPMFSRCGVGLAEREPCP